MPDDDIHLTPRELADLATVAMRMRSTVVAEITSVLGPEATNPLMASLYCATLAFALGDLVQREPDASVPTDLINRVWRASRWPLHLSLDRTH